jgi:hypothetical protein
MRLEKMLNYANFVGVEIKFMNYLFKIVGAPIFIMKKVAAGSRYKKLWFCKKNHN